LDKIPRDQLTADLLLTRNDNGDTPLHAAAYEGHLDQVPRELLTPERIGTRNYDGLTVLKTALNRGFENQLPEDVRPRKMGPIRRFLHNLGRRRVPF
ncbi:MAG: hypothetical protein ACRES9_06155, partial [Gammaproteobacteria bacterium]